MKFTTSVDSQERYVPLGPIAHSDRLVVVLDGSDVVGSVAIADTLSIRIEQRSSFKHPIIGLVLGAILIAAPVGATLSAVIFPPVLTISLTLIGLYLVIAAARVRKVPWLIALTKTGERAFMLYGTVTPEVEAFVHALNESRNASESSVVARAIGFPVKTLN
jgi:hypothetical protein